MQDAQMPYTGGMAGQYSAPTVAQPSNIDDATAKVRGAANRIAGLIIGLSEVSDRLTGPVPAAVKDNAQLTEVPGLVPKLNNELDHLHREIDTLEAALQRLQASI